MRNEPAGIEPPVRPASGENGVLPPPSPDLPRHVTITVAGHGSATATVQERVLVALERAQGFGRLTGLPRRLPVGCRRGGCGICRARVLEGRYRAGPMSRDHVSEAEEADGVVLSCAIYALSDLTLRLEPGVVGKKNGRMADKS